MILNFIPFFDEITLSKQYSPRWAAAFCGVTSGALLFAHVPQKGYQAYTSLRVEMTKFFPVFERRIHSKALLSAIQYYIHIYFFVSTGCNRNSTIITSIDHNVGQIISNINNIAFVALFLA